MDKLILPTSEKAIDFIPQATALLDRVIDSDAWSRDYEIDGAIIRIVNDNGNARAYIIAPDIPIFATHPADKHTSPYPLADQKRGTIDLDLSYEKDEEVSTGNIYWLGVDGDVLSWKGSPGYSIAASKDNPFGQIIGEDPQNNEGFSGYFFYTAFSGSVYQDEDILWTAPEGYLVLGACLFGGALVVVCRQFTAHFDLVVLVDGEEKARLPTGRFNNVWNFKKNGSAGVSYYDGEIYRLTVSADSCSLSKAPSPGVDPMFSIQSQITYINEAAPPFLIPDKCSGMGLVPTTYKTMDEECKQAWDRLISYENWNTKGVSIIASTPAPLKYLVGMGYDDGDNEIEIFAEITANIKHSYKTTQTMIKGDMLVLPGHSGTTFIIPDPLKVGSIVSAVACAGDEDSIVSFNASVPYTKLSKVSLRIDSLEHVCEVRFEANDCTNMNSFAVIPLPNTLEIHAPSEIYSFPSGVSASGGTPPYTFSSDKLIVDAHTGVITGAQSCGHGERAIAEVKVKDSCYERAADVKIVGHWVLYVVDPTYSMCGDFAGGAFHNVYSVWQDSRGTICLGTGDFTYRDSSPDTIVTRRDYNVNYVNGGSSSSTSYHSPCMQAVGSISPCTLGFEISEQGGGDHNVIVSIQAEVIEYRWECV